MGGIRASKNPNRLPISGNIRQWERRTLNEINQGPEEGRVEVAAMFDTSGNPIDAYVGDRHSVSFDVRKLNAPETEGATFTHMHPNSNFGGTLSLQDLKVFARSNWGEMRAYTKQGQLYSIKANENVDREGLKKWLNSKESIIKKNFAQSYEKALNDAQKTLKSGPNAGKVKIIDKVTKRTDKNGKERTKIIYKYVKPMTDAQAAAYARQVSVGSIERAYRNGLAQFGVTFTKTKGGKSNS